MGLFVWINYLGDTMKILNFSPLILFHLFFLYFAIHSNSIGDIELSAFMVAQPFSYLFYILYKEVITMLDADFNDYALVAFLYLSGVLQYYLLSILFCSIISFFKGK